MSISLALVLHAHQPPGNFDEVIERAYQTAYRPFLAAAAARPWLRLNLHFSGFLLDWLAERHPEYLELLRSLLAARRLELLGGGYFEPILPAIPAAHQQEQLARLAAALERHFGCRPQGVWVAERVWEPELASVLAQAGARYTLLDDSHFESAGLPSSDLHGYWLTENQGAELAVAPSNFFLRQALPFRPEGEALEYLQAAAERHPSSLLTMGDDLEKFGSWPHTAVHVYGDGWLERFLDGLEARGEQIETVRLSDYLARQPPRGLVYLPTASYPEMMEWARSPSWRGFFTRYRESNLLHRTAWDLYHRLQAAPNPESAQAAAARDHLLAAECNDVYWHGWFGGLYSPHLRNLAFTRMLAADALVESLAPIASPRRFNLLGDGRELIELRSPELRVLVAPGDGGSLEELDLRAANANLINSIQRRPEKYHEDLRRHAQLNPAHLPGATASASNLDALLQYDPYPRSCGRLYLAPPAQGFSEFLSGALDHDPRAAGGEYAVQEAGAAQVELIQDGILKRFALAADSLVISVEIASARLAQRQPILELVFNLLAAEAADRCIRHAGSEHRLTWSAEVPASPLELCDGWRHIQIRLDAHHASHWWVRPLYSVSQGEAGPEALYQGSALAARWPPGTRTLEVRMKFFLSPSHF